MKFRGIDADGDWMFGQGIGSYAQANAAIALDIAARVRSRKGNCFFAPNDGVDYTNLMEKGREKQFDAAMSNCIMQTPGVAAINKVTAVHDRRRRTADLTYDIQTIYSRQYVATISNVTGAS